MKYFLYNIVTVGVAWISFVSDLQADSPISIEIVGVKLADKNQVMVEAEVRNLSKENIKIDPRMWVRTASPKGDYYDDLTEFTIMPGVYRSVLTIYADQTIVNSDGDEVIIGGSWAAMNASTASNYPPPPLVLMPGERKVIPVVIDMGALLLRDFMAGSSKYGSLKSKDVWIRAGLYQSGGEATHEEEQELMNQDHHLTRMEYHQIQQKLQAKYAPKEFTHGDLYKLEKPKEGESSMGLKPIKAPF